MRNEVGRVDGRARGALEPDLWAGLAVSLRELSGWRPPQKKHVGSWIWSVWFAVGEAGDGRP